MDGEILEGEDSKRRGSKTAKRPGGKPAARQASERVKATIHISREASIRLTVHAEMMGLDRSALVEKLIHDHLRRYVISDRGGEAAAEPSAA
jgi:hypothetical protein